MKLKEHVHRDQEHFLYYLTSFIYQLQNPYSNISKSNGLITFAVS